MNMKTFVYLDTITDLVPDFAEVDQSNPNCVVIGDAQDSFTYQNLSRAFETLITMSEPKLFSLGAGYEKYRPV